MSNEYEYEIKAENAGGNREGQLIKAKTPKYVGKLIEDFCEVLRHGDSITIRKRLKDE